MASPVLHAVLSPSSSSRWISCPPSARLCERLEKRFGKKDSPYAREGTMAHALGELKIRNALYHFDGMDTAKLSRMSEEEREAYQGINDFRYKAMREELGEIPRDMEQATDSYCDVVIGKLAATREVDPGAILLLEQRVDLSRWVPGSFGSSDCIIVSDNLLEVIDYKNGVGVPVDAVGNPQIRLYALGALAKYQHLYDFDRVRYSIIQPRLDSMSDETLTVDELLHWAEEVVVPAAKLAWAGQGDFQAGSWCRFCAAKAICSARVAEAMKLFRYGLESPGVIPDEQIPEILATLDLAEAWISDIRTYAESQALRGQKWQGYKLVRGKRPNRKWSDPEEVKAQLLRAGYGLEQFEKHELKPPGEVEKALGKTAFRALLDGLVSQGEGRLTLVPESDKRQEYSSSRVLFDELFSAEAEKTDGE